MTVDTVRLIERGTFDVTPSCLGFGCASLGSRVDARAGLRALHAAFDAGVTWFDVAPAYGAGEAEELLARFLRSHRDQVIVATKVGIAPPQRLGVMKLAYSIGRPLIGAMSGLRSVFRKMSATRNRRVPLDAELIERSIEASLRRLGTDHVDVYALHDPGAADVMRDDIIRALERVLSRGQARHIAVAGKLDACVAGHKVGAPYSTLQMSVEDLMMNRDRFSAETSTRFVTHSVFGVDGMQDRVQAALTKYPDLARKAEASGYGSAVPKAAAEILLDNAFALNPNGVVLASMFNERHLAANIARAKRSVSPQATELLRDILAHG